jgi:integrase
MATGKITTESVKTVPVPPEGKREHLWDDTLKGFGVMVTPNGVRSFIVQYRIGGRGSPTRRVTIGRWGSPWTAKTARDRASEILEQVRRKIDPFDAERAKLQQDKEAKARAEAERRAATHLAFSAFADRFVTRYAKKEQPKTWRDTESVLRRDWKAEFRDRPLPSITAEEIVALLDKVQDERGDSAAIKAYKAGRVLFGWAKDKRQIADNPMRDLKPPATVGKRDRALSDAELLHVWNAAGALGWPFGPIVRLLILTGQRLREVAGMTRDELDLLKAEWLLPGARTKNGLPNLVALNDQAVDIIKALPAVASEKKLLFTTTGKTPVSGFSRVKARLDAMILAAMRKDAADRGDNPEAVSLQQWQFHDLRRTLATGCQRLGVKLEVTEAVLHHISGSRGGLVGVYQVYDYRNEKKDAVAAWGRHVAGLISGKGDETNVVPLAAARAEQVARLG